MKTTNHRREPWTIDESEFYEQESRRGEMEFLLRYGCDEVQGFLFARPMPGDECAEAMACPNWA